MRLPLRLAERLVGGDEHFAVTGASGWFGLTTLHLLSTALGPEAFGRRVTAYASEAKRLRLPGGEEVWAGALGDLVGGRRPSPTHLLHYAYPSRESMATLGVDRFLRAAVEISSTVVGALNEGRWRGVFFASSGAVYGPKGRVTSDVAAHPYAAAKVLDELVIRQTCRDIGATSIVGRVFSVSGPRLGQRPVYALGDLMAQAMDARPVQVHARGLVRRSYVAISDIAAVAVAELLEPSSADLVLDMAGEEVIEVGALAHRVLEVLGRADVPVVRQLDPAVPADDYVGDPAPLKAAAARRGLSLLGLDDQIRQAART